MNKIGKKILIAEDAKNYLWLLSEGCTNEGFTVIGVENGEDALAAIEKEKPDLILSDINMPKLDGISLAKKLQESGIKAPIIFLTNFTDLQHISDAMEAVKDANYIVKSDVGIAEIISRVKSKLGLK